MPEELLGPEPPEPIREAFNWHEQRLSMRGLFPEGLQQGVTIQHKFEDGEVVTKRKAEGFLIVTFKLRRILTKHI